MRYTNKVYTLKKAFFNSFITMKTQNLVVTLTILELANLLDSSISKALSKHQPNKEYLTLIEVCELLGISRNTFGNYVNRGLIIKHKVGSKVLVKRSQLMQAIELGKIG